MGTSTFMSFIFVFSFLFCSSSQFVFTYHIIPQSFPILISVIRYDVNFFLLLNQLLREVIKKRKVSRTKTCGCSYFLRKISFIGSNLLPASRLWDLVQFISVWGGCQSSTNYILIINHISYFPLLLQAPREGTNRSENIHFFCFFSLMEGKLT